MPYTDDIPIPPGGRAYPPDADDEDTMRKLMAMGLLGAGLATGGEVGFSEDFALAKDRNVPLRQLVPGTEDYYYYHALHYLNTQQFDKAQEITKPWIDRFGLTQRVGEIQVRHALLTHGRDPRRSLDFLRDRYGLRFDHQKEIVGAPPNLPTKLDPGLISRDTLFRRAMAMGQHTEGLEESAFQWLSAMELNAGVRRSMLQRLTRPDVPNLVAQVHGDMQLVNSPPFGTLAIHRQLTAAQLVELLRLSPGLINDANYVHLRFAALHPNQDEDWRNDPAKLEAYLDRAAAFTADLPPIFNTLKAHVRYNRLRFDRSRGIFNKERFLEYLKIPRTAGYLSEALRNSDEFTRHAAQLGQDYQPVTLLPDIGNDEDLIRGYFLHFFVREDSTAPYEPWVNVGWLRPVFAEAKITNGLGDPEQWASLLSPEAFKALRERVDIDFAETNPTSPGPDDKVELGITVKNAPNLIVKVFEINTTNWYRSNGREVNSDINLDGLIPNEERTLSFNESPFRRISQRIEFPKLSKPGVYVIDLIGNGRSSRALIRKGRMRPIVSITDAGQKIDIVDEANRKINDALVWLGGREYKAEKDGSILIPFSTSPGSQPIVITRGDFSCLDTLNHEAESYSFAAGIHLEREALLSQRMATVAIRPAMFLNGKPVSIKLLEKVRLKITSIDQDNVSSVTEVPNVRLFEDRETTHEFRVPARLKQIGVSVSGQVKPLTKTEPVTLSADRGFTLNGIDATDKIGDVHLANFAGEHVLEVKGRTGEPLPDLAVRVSLKHRDFRQNVDVMLKSDANGRIALGKLPEIANVTAGIEGSGVTNSWPIGRTPAGAVYRSNLHVKLGESLSLPWSGPEPLTPADVSLFEMRVASTIVDHFERLSAKDGALTIAGLPAGDFELNIKRSGERITIRVVEGDLIGDHLAGQVRHLKVSDLKPLIIQSMTRNGDFVDIKVAQGSTFARVHLFATRFQPAYPAFDSFAAVRDAELGGVLPARWESVYQTGRDIGDEYRYVLDRKGRKKFPGNMLERPALLLNPWAVRSTETGEQLAARGAEFAPASPPAPSAAMATEGRSGGPGGSVGFANLDFLADSAAVILNAVPDKDGNIRINIADLGPHALLHAVAVDPVNTVVRSLALEERNANSLDLRLRRGLDPAGHFIQRKRISLLAKGQPFVLEDATGRQELIDSVSRAYRLFTAISNDPALAEFSFLLEWPKLKPEEKRTHYSKHACHELNFFLLKKDPEFFGAVVKPYLANKKDRTFLDEWLLEADLAPWLSPWRHGRLNAMEKVLLGRRIPKEGNAVVRFLGDRLSLMPKDTARDEQLFGFALATAAMDEGKSIPRFAGNIGDPTAAGKAFFADESAGTQGQLGGLPPGAMPAGPGGGGGGGFGMMPGKPAAPPSGGGRGGRPGAAAARRAMPKSASKEKGEAGAQDMDALALRDGAAALGKEKLAELKDRADKKADDFAERAEVRQSERFMLRRGLSAAQDQLFRQVDPTMEYAENNYRKRPIAEQLADLVAIDPFWLDLARHDGKSPYLSSNLARPTRNFTEMMFALAALDLPFEAGKHETKIENGRLTIIPAGPAVIFHEEIRPAEAAPSTVLVSQNFYRHGERFRTEGGEQVDNFVTGEFLARVVYGCQTVVTNPSSTKRKLSVLVQIPVGAMPLAGAQVTKSITVELEPYRTQTLDYLFYFPLPGKYAHYPVHVSKDEKYVAAAKPVTFEVLAEPSKRDTKSWEWVSQNGTDDEVIEFLTRENVFALNLDRIAFRMKDKAFFQRALPLIAGRHAYSGTLWSYAVLHDDPAAAREFFNHHDRLPNEVGGPIDSPLFAFDPVLRHAYEHLEYKPLVNARAHALGKRRQIVNDRFHEQYERFLKNLSYRTSIDDADRLGLVYYLLLQDRIEEALEQFAQVNPERITTKLQYDCAAAWLDFFSDEPRKARAIAQRHENHPVDRWRNVFRAMLAKLDEIEGGKPAGTRAEEDVAARQAAQAAAEPAFEFTVEGGKIELTSQNLPSVRVNYYLMDVELLFSRNPFAGQAGGQFASIRPNLTGELKLKANVRKQSFALPKELADRNVLVEITAAGKTRTQAWYAGTLDVRMMENYGQLKVADRGTGRAVSKAYVKVYVRTADGQVKFHKDGYTDLAGRFDYATVSTPEKSAPARFAVLVLSEEKGARVQEANPPQR